MRSGPAPGPAATALAWSRPAVIGALAALYAAIMAGRMAWTCDDAFISFRYASNLVEGRGLVFNPLERVEGYSNFLWTLGVAFGMTLGVDPETWSIAWGVAFYAATVLLLALRSRRTHTGRAALAWPVAAVLAAAHPDWQVFATSGLETASFTFLAVLCFMLLTGRETGLARTACAGAVSALLAMTRPDGLLLAGLAGAFVLVFQRSRLSATVAFATPFVLLWGPYTAWRLWYFGDVFPNPYYAKSAYAAWHAQGWTYLSLYFQKYWLALIGPALAAAAMVAVSRRPAETPDSGSVAHERREALLAMAFALGYMAFVFQVGGDFMFARFLIPATPFLFILLEMGFDRLMPDRADVRALVLLAAGAAMIATPHPLPRPDSTVAGIVNERLQYPASACLETRRRGVMLATRYFHDLPVIMAFLGSEARLVYYARPRTAIESETGLTDRTIARRILRRRGRVGHEKVATLDYLTRDRGAHLIFHARAPAMLDLPGRLPQETMTLDDASAIVLTWDPELMAALRERGAQFADFPARLDSTIAGLDTLGIADVRRIYSAVGRFYFAHVSDAAREAPFRRRLGLPGPGEQPHPRR